MYGMLLESIQHFVNSDYGEDMWNKCLEEAGYKNTVFTTKQKYPEGLVVALAEACSKHTALHDPSTTTSSTDFLVYFGRCFVLFFSHYGYDKLIRATGRHFRDFLNGIDNLHHQIRFSYPKMSSPSFYIESESQYGAILHYRSKRTGFAQYVQGQLLQIASSFYELDIEVSILKKEEDSNGSHVVFDVRFDNYPYHDWLQAQQMRRLVEESPDQQLCPLPIDIFTQLFPFGLIFGQSMELILVGERVQELSKEDSIVGQHITKFFSLHTPRMPFTWETVLTLQKVVVELAFLKVIRNTNSEGDSDHYGSNFRNMLLKGQMRYFEEWNAVAYICVPLLSNIQELQDAGLYLSDLCFHDGSQQVTMAGSVKNANLEMAFEKLESRSKVLEDNLSKLDEWRQRGDELLYSMIPKQVAKRLRNGEDPVHTCETFSDVTVLFSELVTYHDLCEVLGPWEIVSYINDVFSNFDRITDKYGVYKVETAGDVYMLVSGAPERRADHAQQAAKTSLDLLEYVTSCPPLPQSISPSDPPELHGGPRLKLRMGMHSGSVVAGVVGRRMLRYCFFGDTVNTASRMQSHSQVGRIQISETCWECLPESEFSSMFRGTIQVKGKGSMATYWLIGTK